MKTKTTKLKNGVIMRNGMLIIPAGPQGHRTAMKGNDMTTDNGQRAAMAHAMRPKIGRDATVEKKLTEAQPFFGQTRQTKPSHEFLHGAPLDDEPNIPFKLHEKPVAIHSGMTMAQKVKFDPLDGARVLKDAGNLGRKA